MGIDDATAKKEDDGDAESRRGRRVDGGDSTASSTLFLSNCSYSSLMIALSRWIFVSSFSIAGSISWRRSPGNSTLGLSIRARAARSRLRSSIIDDTPLTTTDV